MPSRQPAYWFSCALGAIGLQLIFIGLVAREDAIFVVGAAAGAVSLIAALVWRSELVSTWRHDHPRT